MEVFLKNIFHLQQFGNIDEQIPQFRTQIGTKRKMLQAAKEPFPLTTSRNGKASDLEASWVWCRKYPKYLLYLPLMSQANIPFFRAAKNGLSVDSVSQWKLEVERGCAIITLHMPFFTSEQLPVVSLLSLITVTSKKSPPASSATDSSVRVGVHKCDRFAVGPFICMWIHLHSWS